MEWRPNRSVIAFEVMLHIYLVPGGKTLVPMHVFWQIVIGRIH
jgi:hypothetical protein